MGLNLLKAVRVIMFLKAVLYATLFGVCFEGVVLFEGLK